jgi:hypothetical protein
VWAFASFQELVAQSTERERVEQKAVCPPSRLVAKHQFLAQITNPQVFVIAS